MALKITIGTDAKKDKDLQTFLKIINKNLADPFPDIETYFTQRFSDEIDDLLVGIDEAELEEVRIRYREKDETIRAQVKALLDITVFP